MPLEWSHPLLLALPLEWSQPLSLEWFCPTAKGLAICPQILGVSSGRLRGKYHNLLAVKSSWALAGDPQRKGSWV